MSANPEPPVRLTKAEVEAILSAFSPADWQRAQSIANLLNLGVTGWTPSDLLQEAMVNLLDGTRAWPREVHPLVVLKTVMRSIASNARKHNQASPIDANTIVDPLATDEDGRTAVAHGRVDLTPEDQLSGKQQLVALYAKLGGDKDLEDLATAWSYGLRGNEARQELGWDVRKYDKERQRLQRRLNEFDPDRRPK
ncbi:hypothetical protein [Acidovorax sp.]|uniref:hypothetical protein n=1 Tax=Acidovorax sp. TaxID=1872122 RepID=UPI00391EEF13